MTQNNPMRLSDLLTPHWLGVAGSCVLIIGTVCANFYLPFLTKDVVDALQNETAVMSWLLKMVGMYFAVACVSALCARYMRRGLVMVGHRTANRLRRLVFEQLTRLDRGFYLNEQTGDIMTRMTSDITAVTDMIGQGILHTFRAIITFIIGFIVMFSIDKQLATVVAILLPTMTLMVFCIIFMLRKLYQASQEQFSILSSFAQENFAGIRLVKGFGIEDRQHEAFEAINQEYRMRNLKQSRVEAPSWPMIGAMFVGGLVIIVYLGGERVIRGEEGITIGTIAQFMQFFFYVQWPMIALGWTMNLMVKGTISWKRIRHLLDSVPAIQDGGRELENLSGDVEFRHVSLSFGEITVLDDVSLVIPEGKVIGLTGPTGCGKTMLASLLVRQYDPSEGQVYIGLEDVRDLSVQQLRDHVRIALQEPFLFSESIADNIALAEEHTSLERIEWAADVARLRNEAENFPNGFRTELGERGVTLSGGQRQRTSIARAVLGNPALLILDDTLSAVDTQTEAGILDNLRPILAERTALVISHRISSLRDCDEIVVMDQGRIVQQGTHEVLIAKDGYYRELDIMQRLAARLEGEV